MPTEPLTVMDEHTPLDLLLYRRFAAEVAGRVERTLELNPGLAAAGAFLPVGTVVIVEVPAPSSSPRTQRVTRLWD